MLRNRYAPTKKLDGHVMQQANRALVLKLVRTEPAQSRVDLVRKTGLSPATITDIVDHLLREGLVREDGAAVTGAVGRRPLQLAFNPDARLALGIDVDVREVRVALVNLGGTARSIQCAPVPHGAGPEEVLDIAASLARQALRDVPTTAVLGVGMAVPGMVQWPKGINLFSPSFGWRDIPIRSLIEERLGQPVLVDNEVRAFALAEHYFGAARHARNVVFLDVSYGVGGAIIIEGNLYRGTHGTAGELGHNIVMLDGPRCGCGNYGCLASFASASGLVARCLDALANGGSSTLATVPSDVLTLDHIVAAADAGDVLTRELLAHAVMYLGLTVANAVDNWDPELVVLGGSVIRTGGSFFTDLLAVEQRVVLETARARVQVVHSALDVEAEIIGAATLVIADYLTEPV